MIGEISERTAASLERDLNACAGASVTVTVDSPGGDLLAGTRIANVVREHGQVTATLKRGDSAALAFCAAKTVRVVEGVSYLVHQPVVEIPHSVAVSGPEMHEAADAMARSFVLFSRALGDRRIRDDAFRSLAAEDRRLTAIEMVRHGLADSVVPAAGGDENGGDDDISEEEIAEIVQDSIRRQLDAARSR